MSKQFLHVAFNWQGDSKIGDVQTILNQATDWVRYAPNCWLIWTGRDVETWYEKLKPVLSTGDHLLICRIDLTVRKGCYLGQSGIG